MSSIDSLQWLEQYAVVVLPALVVAEQVGVPLPAVPALLGVGALAANGRLSVASIFATMAVAALAVDFTWYEIGRRRGAPVLARLCRVAVEPDSCVRQAENVFSRYGARAMLLAKFFPGLTTVLPPIAGIFAVNRVRFALYDLGGVLLWAGAWTALGYAFSDAIAVIAARAATAGRTAGVIIAAALVAYIALKYIRRRLFMRTLRMARVSPEAVKQSLDAGEDVTIIDLRTRLDVAATPYAIPGSRWIAADELAANSVNDLRGHDVVLYCS